jgi:hypothetical protein
LEALHRDINVNLETQWNRLTIRASFSTEAAAPPSAPVDGSLRAGDLLSEKNADLSEIPTGQHKASIKLFPGSRVCAAATVIVRGKI